MQTLLTRENCRLVQASFAEIAPIASDVAATFYRRLFDLNPSLVSLFKTDMQLQGVRFMEKLAVVVQGLDDIESIAPLVQVLGRRHAGYGVQPDDYDSVEEALLWTLGEALGPAFNSEVRNAWSSAFQMLSTEMIRTAEGQPKE